MLQFEARNLLIVLAVGLLLWGARHDFKWDRLIPWPGTRLSLPRVDLPGMDWAADFAVESGRVAEMGERVVCSGVALAQHLPRGAMNLARRLRPVWDPPQQPTAERRRVRTVVVDPGHGGRDPGAIGVGGLQEKSVTLRLSRALRTELESRGFRVVTTRSGDQTVSLERRIATAEQQGADLFLSLHANAAIQAEVRGMGTYYSDESLAQHDPHEADRLGDNPDHLQRNLAERPVTSVLSRTPRLSAELARAIHRRAISSVRERYRPLSDRGVSGGPFYVLFSSMPAVLMEIGFLTHEEEAARMRSDLYLSLLAKAIAEGLAEYRDAGDWNRAHATIALRPPDAVIPAGG